MHTLPSPPALSRRLVDSSPFVSHPKNEEKVTLIATQPNFNQNHLLAALPKAVIERLAPHLELVSIALGEVLQESGDPLLTVYFPTTAIISLHYVTENGASTEIAGVGNEGVLGISLLMGSHTSPNMATVQTAGNTFRLKKRFILDEFNRVGGRRKGALHNLMLRYTQALMTQIAQTAVCNRHHSIEQQLCRWLLLTLDRLPTNELTITQELIAGMLGVRREGVTEAAGKLQKAGLISYRRGHITVLDRTGLESVTCECYQVVRDEFERLLGDLPILTK